MLSAHGRGEHAYNLVFARAGCSLCQADVDEVRRRTAESIEEAARARLVGQPPEEIERVIESVKAVARAEGFL